MFVRITPQAQQEILHILQTKNIPEGYLLRIAIKGSGCSHQYSVGFDTPTKYDEKFSEGNLTYLIDKRHLLYLTNVILDFEERDQERGFVFKKET